MSFNYERSKDNKVNARLAQNRSIRALVKQDPKPSELAAGSLKHPQQEVEERTGDCGKNLR